MKKVFFVKESATEILLSLLNSDNFDLFEVVKDSLYPSNYIPFGMGTRKEGFNTRYMLVESLHQLRFNSKYHILDSEFNSYATLSFTKKGFDIKTAMSGFIYSFEESGIDMPTEGGKRSILKCTYKGAEKGFMAQSLLPNFTVWDVDFIEFQETPEMVNREWPKPQSYLIPSHLRDELKSYLISIKEWEIKHPYRGGWRKQSELVEMPVNKGAMSWINCNPIE